MRLLRAATLPVPPPPPRRSVSATASSSAFSRPNAPSLGGHAAAATSVGSDAHSTASTISASSDAPSVDDLGLVEHLASGLISQAITASSTDEGRFDVDAVTQRVYNLLTDEISGEVVYTPHNKRRVCIHLLALVHREYRLVEQRSSLRSTVSFNHSGSGDAVAAASAFRPTVASYNLQAAINTVFSTTTPSGVVWQFIHMAKADASSLISIETTAARVGFLLLLSLVSTQGLSDWHLRESVFDRPSTDLLISARSAAPSVSTAKGIAVGPLCSWLKLQIVKEITIGEFFKTGGHDSSRI